MPTLTMVEHVMIDKNCMINNNFLSDFSDRGFCVVRSVVEESRVDKLKSYLDIRKLPKKIKNARVFTLNKRVTRTMYHVVKINQKYFQQKTPLVELPLQFCHHRDQLLSYQDFLDQAR